MLKCNSCKYSKQQIAVFIYLFIYSGKNQGVNGNSRVDLRLRQRSCYGSLGSVLEEELGPCRLPKRKQTTNSSEEKEKDIIHCLELSGKEPGTARGLGPMGPIFLYFLGVVSLLKLNT
jgi:hypothetical protein